MKRFVFFLVVILLGLNACKHNETEDANCSCPTVPLGITQDYNFLWQDYDSATNPEPNPQWSWLRYADTLKISINIPTGGESGAWEELLFKLENNCVRFIKKVDYYGDDEEVFDENGNLIYGGLQITEDSSGFFELQEWIPDRRIVGQYTNNAVVPGVTKFWVEAN